MICIDRWVELKPGDVVYALQDLHSYSDECGMQRYAKKGDKLIFREYSKWTPHWNAAVSHEDVTDGSAFYASRSELSQMQHFSWN